MRYRSILITGGSSGLGFELAQVLAPHTHTLIVTGRNIERLQHLERLVSSHLILIQADLSIPSEREKIKELLDREKPELFIHNAGLGAYGSFSEIPYEKSEEIVSVNVEAVVELTHHYLKTLQKTNLPGKLVFISSLAGFIPFPHVAIYAATKSFITSFSEALRFELLHSPIKVLTVCPGSFHTNFRTRAQGKAIISEGSTQETKEVAKKIAKAIHTKTGVYIPFLLWKVMYWLSKCLPNTWIAKVLQSHIKKSYQI